MRSRDRRLGTAFGMALLASGASWAAGSRAITVSTAQQFLEGTTDGTTIRPVGFVELGGEFQTLWGPESGIVWRVQADRRVYWLALSSPGRLLRWRDGAAEDWYAPTDERVMTSMALDRAGRPWVGINPGGRVVRFADKERLDATVETGAQFAWALATGADGGLWIGTGSPGRLMHRSADGETTTLLELGDDPVRCLMVSSSGSVVAGTGNRGRVLRVTPDGNVYALFDAAEDEVVALLEGDEGSLWVLAARGARQLTPVGVATAATGEVAETVRVVASAPPTSGNSEANGDPSTREEGRAPTRWVGPRGGALYHIDSGGATRRVWETLVETPFAMVRWGSDIVIGTGDMGRIYSVTESNGASLLGRIGGEQASALAVAGDELLVGGTTDARLERIRRSLAESGTYLSRPLDAGAAARWGQVSWRAEVPAGSSLVVSGRAGNTEMPDEFWGDWETLGEGAQGETTPAFPAARRLQLKFELRRNAEGSSPRLLWFDCRFLAPNHPPAIERLTVEPPNVVWSRPAPQPPRPSPIVADDPRAREIGDVIDGGAARTMAIRKEFEPGARTVSWQVRDSDGDRIAWRLALARDGVEPWIPIGSGTGEEFSSWDSRALPDGEYRALLSVDDAPDNANDATRTATATSEVFVIDHSRPRIDQDTLGRSDLRFTARDPGGRLAAIEWALDDGAWGFLVPADGVTDGSEEHYEISLERPEVLRATALRVRVTDAAGNVSGNVWSLPQR